MLANLIVERMQKLGLNQRDLARRSGLSPQYISDLIASRRGKRLSVTTQAKLAKGLKISIYRVASCVATPEKIPSPKPKVNKT